MQRKGEGIWAKFNFLRHGIPMNGAGGGEVSEEVNLFSLILILKGMEKNSPKVSLKKRNNYF